MKKLIFFLILSCVQISKAQYTKESFLDSLKSCNYLQPYFNNVDNYTDSSFIKYMTNLAEIDTFEIDTNAGFGYKPTKISFSYKNVDFLKFYTGLSISFFKDRSISGLSFYNYGSQKTAIEWTFYPNGKIKEKIKYKSTSVDSVKDFGKLISPVQEYQFDKFSKTGRIELSGAYKNKKKHGDWYYFNKKGFLYRKEMYKEGKRLSRISF